MDQCSDLKVNYDRCFNNWYRHEFLRKEPTPNPCDEYFEDYRACVLERLSAAGLKHLADFDPQFEARARQP